MDRDKAWLQARDYSHEQLETARMILEDVKSGMDVDRAVRRHPQPSGGYVAKHVLVHTYRDLTERGEWTFDPAFLRRIRMKPSRTLSGVTTVTVLTKPYPCPGKCIFCPTDVRAPKSYLPDEPGVMRAIHNEYDPFDQTAARIQALESIGHPTDKIELLILGGTWSAYREDYQEWFIQRCLEAMNGYHSPSLQEAQRENEVAPHRNVGMVIETRPDWVTVEEVKRLRALGVTKVQVGAQSLNDSILERNHRGHDVEQLWKAMALLRRAGFKIVLHWMPNLLGATLESDRQDFPLLWEDAALRPDELKIYPCQLLENAELYEYWRRGEYQPYTTEELIELISDLKPKIPRYCRVNRIVRDIPSPNVVAGNKRTSLRQDIQRELKRRGLRCECIRCREVRGTKIAPERLEFGDLVYETRGSEEHFLSYSTRTDKIAGYVRLSLPNGSAPKLGFPELEGSALIRELHVYGPSVPFGEEREGAAQHVGLGQDLMERAEGVARDRGFRRMAVISALGTRGYYRKLGYELGNTYMIKGF